MADIPNRLLYPTDLVQLVSFLTRVAAVKRKCYIIIDGQGLRSLQKWLGVSWDADNKAPQVMGFPLLYILQANVNICIIVEDENTKPVIDKMIQLKQLYLKLPEVPF